MTKTNFKKVIETKAEDLSIEKVEKKEFLDEAGTKITYKQVKCVYSHPQDNGSKVRARPNFALQAEIEQPRGLKFGLKNKLSAFTVFDTNNEDLKLFISSKEKTQSRGWIPDENVKIITRGGKTFAKASRDGQLFSSPSEEEESVLSFEKGDVMTVEDQKEVDDDNTWYLVSAGGQEGFFSTMANRIAELIHADKRCGLEALSLSDVRKKIKDPIYYPVDKETNKPIDGKSPSMFFTCSYFAVSERNKKENYVKYKVPGLPDHLDLQTLTKSAFKLKSIVIQLIDIYIGGDKIVPHFYITEALVNDISEIKITDELDEEMKATEEDSELVAKLRKQLAASKKFEAPHVPEVKDEAIASLNGNTEEKDEEDNQNFNDLIGNEPKESKLGDLKPTMKSNVVIPGLPDDD